MSAFSGHTFLYIPLALLAMSGGIQAIDTATSVRPIVSTPRWQIHCKR